MFSMLNISMSAVAAVGLSSWYFDGLLSMPHEPVRQWLVLLAVDTADCTDVIGDCRNQRQ